MRFITKYDSVKPSSKHKKKKKKVSVKKKWSISIQSKKKKKKEYNMNRKYKYSDKLLTSDFDFDQLSKDDVEQDDIELYLQYADEESHQLTCECEYDCYGRIYCYYCTEKKREKIRKKREMTIMEINSFRTFILCLRKKNLHYLEPLFYKLIPNLIFGLYNPKVKFIIEREINFKRYEFEHKLSILRPEIEYTTFKYQTNPSKYNTEAYQILEFKKYFNAYEKIVFKKELGSLFPSSITFKKNVWV